MTTITVEELKQKMDAGETINLIDVREPAEYAADNIGGKLMPLGTILGMQLEAIDELKDQEVIVHCKAGVRSLQACLVLEQAGFSNVVNVAGGLLAWRQKYPA